MDQTYFFPMMVIARSTLHWLLHLLHMFFQVHAKSRKKAPSTMTSGGEASNSR